MNTNQIKTPPLPLPFSRSALRVSGKTYSVWEQNEITDAWSLLAGPFCPEGSPHDEALLRRHLDQVEGTWSLLVRTGEDEFCIYRHGDELNPYVQKSGAVFVRSGYAEWRRDYAEYWADKGCFYVE